MALAKGSVVNEKKTMTVSLGIIIIVGAGLVVENLKVITAVDIKAFYKGWLLLFIWMMTMTIIMLLVLFTKTLTSLLLLLLDGGKSYSVVLHVIDSVIATQEGIANNPQFKPRNI